MGAGSSARSKQLEAEKKLREDAERKAEAEALARRKVEEELLATRRELESVKSLLSLPSDRALPWKPCRTNKVLAAPFPLARVIIYHDGENCWVPNHADLRFAAVRDALSRIVARSVACTGGS